MSFRRALLITIGAQALSLIVSVLFILLASRWLGAEGKGVQSLVTSLGQILAIVLGLGFQSALPAIVGANASLAVPALKVQARLVTFGCVLLLLALLLNRVVAIAPALSGYEVSLLVFVAATMAQPFLATLVLSMGDAVVSNLSISVAAAISLGSLFFLKAIDRVTITSVIGAQSLGFIAAVTLTLVLMRNQWSRRNGAPVERLSVATYLRPSMLGLLSATFALLMFRGDLLLVTKLGAGVRAAGIYSVAVFAAEMALRLPQWSASVLSPAVAADSTKGLDRTVKLFWLSIAVAFLALIGAVVLRVPATAILAKLAGAEFSAAYPALLAIMPRVVLQAGTSILAGNLAGKGYTYYHPAACAAGMLSVWACDFMLIPRYGIVGAGIGASIGYVPAAVIMFAGFMKYNNCTPRQFFSMALPSMQPVT